MGDMLRRATRRAAGLVIGAATAVVELLFTVLVGLALLGVPAWPRGRRAVLVPAAAVARRLTGIERSRMRRFLDLYVSVTYDDHQALRYVAARWALGALGGIVVLAGLIGAAYGTAWIYVPPFAEIRNPYTFAAGCLGGLFLLFLSAQGISGVAALEERLARLFLGPSHQEELKLRIIQLATSRAGVVEVVHEERRRIERDLHDGVQQRLVALGMLLGRARRSHDTGRTDELLRQAHEESQELLTELREVAWRVYPTVLDEAGLRIALETVAERSSIPVRVQYDVPEEPEPAVSAVAYFVISEAVTNAVKHSGADLIAVRLRTGPGAVPAQRALHIAVTDNGRGGADIAGSGLFGLARRVDALDGLLVVDSPAGGPTTITVELPCG